jgi:hypothetical protein
VIAQNLSGLQYFRLLGPWFDHLHRVFRPNPKP